MLDSNLVEGYDEAAQTVDLELPQIIRKFLDKQITSEQARKQLIDLKDEVAVQQKLEGMTASELNPKNTEFGPEMVERYNYGQLLNEINRAINQASLPTRVKIKPDKF